MYVANSSAVPSGLSVARNASQYAMVPAYTLPPSAGSNANAVVCASRRRPIGDQLWPASWLTVLPSLDETKTVDGSAGDTPIAATYAVPKWFTGNHSVPPDTVIHNPLWVPIYATCGVFGSAARAVIAHCILVFVPIHGPPAVLRNTPWLLAA